MFAMNQCTVPLCAVGSEYISRRRQKGRGSVEKKSKKKRVLYYIVFFVATAFLMLCTALIGYRVASVYKESITNAYRTTVDKVSSRIDSLQSDVLDETSKIKEKSNDD